MTSLPWLCVPFPFPSFLASSFQKIPSLSWLNSGVKDFVHEIKGGVGEDGNQLLSCVSLSCVFRQKASEGREVCLVNIYYESSSFTNSLIFHIRKLSLRKVKLTYPKSLA